MKGSMLLLTVPPTFLLGAIVWKLTLADPGEPLFVQTVAGETTPTPPDDAHATGGAPATSPSEGPPGEELPRVEVDYNNLMAERARMDGLIEQCESGRFSSCDEATAICLTVVPAPPSKTYKKRPRQREWHAIAGAKKHSSAAMRMGCRPYFYSMACTSGSDKHCLLSAVRPALAMGCDRGCSACCDTLTEELPEDHPRKQIVQCEGGDPDACLRASGLAKNQRRLIDARQYAERACQLEQKACYRLAHFAAEGLGGTRDRALALSLLEKSWNAPAPDVNCEPRGSIRCGKLTGLTYLDLKAAYDRKGAQVRCASDDWGACLGLMQMTQTDYKRSMDDMADAAVRLYPACRKLLGRCEQAVLECKRGELRACLAVVGRPAFAQEGDLQAAYSRLKSRCEQGERVACVQ